MPETVRVLIVEDEMIIAAKISMHLEQLGYEVVGILPRGEEAVVHCRAALPDLLLLDVNLKGVIDGIETARILQKEGLEVPIIYLTANADQGTFDRAKSTRPRAFLNKPYRKTDLARAIELAVLAAPAPSSPAAKSPTEEAHILTDRIFVRHKERMVKIFLKDILYIEADRAYCKIMTVNTEYMLSIAMGKLTDQLHNNEFMRVHRSYVINLKAIDEIGDNYVAIAGKAIPIGKSHRAAFGARVNLIR
ncbi:LytR/AlgR family response regulator transcription factor [Neolewinella antarctica]|uniref:DNA-binding LytR/AlgR family response regulator n=1 Tax=Neolewinella antarctica TaxID=442734 RepID=A0ABX0XGP8_9BACT|nr:response regulator transcription factor [Neolewinella antarctica]NJC28056.1 DNA-binding LytR/AlgR family response regulator [Neolewinella antarctica]